MTTQENSAEMSLEPTARSVPLVAGDTPAMWEWAEQLVARQTAAHRAHLADRNDTTPAPNATA